MTNNEALRALALIGELPMTGHGAHVAPLILITADLRRIARDLESQRRDILDAARSAAEAPDTFEADLADYLADKEAHADFAPVLARVDTHFGPAWDKLLSTEAQLRFPLLSPAQFASLVEALPDSDSGRATAFAVAELIVMP